MNFGLLTCGRLLDLLVGQLLNARCDRNIAQIFRVNFGVIEGGCTRIGYRVNAGPRFINITPPGQDMFRLVLYKCLVNNFAIAGAKADEVLGTGLGFSVCNHGFVRYLSKLFLRKKSLS